MEGKPIKLCYADKVLIEQGLITLQEILIPNKLPSHKTADTNLVHL